MMQGRIFPVIKSRVIKKFHLNKVRGWPIYFPTSVEKLLYISLRHAKLYCEFNLGV